MAKRVRKFQMKGVWKVFENGKFIGYAVKLRSGWMVNGRDKYYPDLRTAVQML